MLVHLEETIEVLPRYQAEGEACVWRYQQSGSAMGLNSCPDAIRPMWPEFLVGGKTRLIPSQNRTKWRYMFESPKPLM
jgi:hypothetical protein